MKDLDDIHKVAVIGGGIMGSGVAVEFARFGFDVTLHEVRKKTHDNIMKQAREDLYLMVDADLLPETDVKKVMSNLRVTDDFENAVKDADYVLEAVPEVLGLKQDIFTRLDQVCRKDTILASTSSAIEADELGRNARYPERILVTHYYSPPHLMPLVEVFPGEKTDSKNIDRVVALLESLRKKVYVFGKEQLVHIGNRFQSAIAREAQKLFDEGLSPEEIDGTVIFGFGRRMSSMGYFQRMDMVGLDGRLERYKAMGHEPWQPILDRTGRGDLGMKSGKGFHEWPGDSGQHSIGSMKRRLAYLLKQDLDENLI